MLWLSCTHEKKIVIQQIKSMIIKESGKKTHTNTQKAKPYTNHV